MVNLEQDWIQNMRSERRNLNIFLLDGRMHFAIICPGIWDVSTYLDHIEGSLTGVSIENYPWHSEEFISLGDDYETEEGMQMDYYLKDHYGEYIYLKIDLQADNGQIYILRLFCNSLIAKDILNCLASVEDLGTIKIEIFPTGQFVTLADGSKEEILISKVYNGNIKLKWKFVNLPEVVDFKEGINMQKDASAQMELYRQVAQSIPTLKVRTGHDFIKNGCQKEELVYKLLQDKQAIELWNRKNNPNYDSIASL